MMKTTLSLILVAVAFGATTVKADLIAHYNFDESSGTTAANNIGSIHGTLSGGATFVGGGISGNAVDLTGTSALVSMGDNFGLLGTDFSIVFWVNTTTIGNAIYPLSKHEAGADNGYIFLINQDPANGADDKVTFVASQSPNIAPSSTTSVNDGLWHQVVGVHVQGGDNLLYVDGSLEASISNVDLVGNAASFLLGGFSQGGTPTSSYNGLIDELQIYDHALTANQVGFLFNNPGSAIPEPSSLLLLGFATVGLIARRRRRS